jgi:hypothetical protein
LTLPRHRELAPPHRFGPAETTPRMAHERLRATSRSRTASRSDDGAYLLVDEQDDGRVRLDAPGGLDEQGRDLAGLTFDARSLDRYAVRADEPTSATVECRRDLALARGSWNVTITAVGRMSVTPDGQCFQLEHELTAFEDGRDIWHRTWDTTIPIDRPETGA